MHGSKKGSREHIELQIESGVGVNQKLKIFNLKQLKTPEYILKRF